MGKNNELSYSQLAYSKTNEVTTNSPKIVVVDDNPTFLKLMHVLFELEGYGVTTFNNSLKAAQSLQKGHRRFDVGIFDLNMPNMNGIKLIQTLIDSGSDLPILLVSAYYEDLSKFKSKNSTIITMRKPFSVETIIANVQTLTSMPRPSRTTNKQEDVT